MDSMIYIKAVFGLLLVMGLIVFTGWAGRRWGPKIAAAGPHRRMKLQEVLHLGPKRKLAIVRIDGDEWLILASPNNDQITPLGKIEKDV